jgi:hypothetical protein
VSECIPCLQWARTQSLEVLPRWNERLSDENLPPATLVWSLPRDPIHSGLLFWTSLGTCAFKHHPATVEAARWRDHDRVPEAWLEQHIILKKFRRPSLIPECSLIIEREIMWPTNIKYYQVLHNIEIDYPVELVLVNKRELDYCPIPSHINRKQIPKPFIKQHLENLASGGRLFLKAFYWDLWMDLTNLHLEF